MEKQDNSGMSPTAYRHSPGIFHRDISPKGTTLTIQKEGHNEIMKVHIPENQQYKLKYKVKNEDPEQNTRLHNTQ